MSFITLNGLALPVIEGRRRQVTIGSDSRSFAGSYRLGRRAVRQEWEFRAGPVSPAEGLALRAFISGDGHTLSFDSDKFSSRGLGQANTSGSVFQPAKFGGGLVTTVGASSTWAMQLGASWTTLHHAYSTSLSTWAHHINRSDGARWIQGSPGASAGGLTVSAGAVSLTGAVGISSFDDAVGLPFAVPDAWIPGLFAWHATRAWSALPYLTAGGSFTTAEVRVLGEIKDSEFVEFVQGGARLVGERFNFILREV